MANPFTPEQISQILEAFFNTVGTRQYIGARYVPIFGRKDEESIEWDNTKPYEPLTIVLYQGNSYTSRQYVPAGVEITNELFWANTGNYNAQIEQYRRETARALQAAQTAQESADNAQNDIDTLLPKSDFSAEATVKDYIDNVSRVIPFKTVAEMQQSTELKEGFVCKTEGFYSSGDNGAGWYLINNTDSPNGLNVISVGNELVASLVVNPYMVTPEQFGAHGDGQTDDYANVAKALELGDTILLSKDYKISSPVRVEGKNAFTITGNGTLTFEYVIVQSETKYFNLVNCDNVQIDGITFRSTYGVSNASLDLTDLFKNNFFGLFLNDCNHVNVENCTFAMFNDGIHVNDSSHVVVSKCNFENNAQEHAVFENCTGCSFINNDCKWNSGDGVIIKHYSEATPANFLFEGNVLHDGKETLITQIDQTVVWNIGGGFTCNCEGHTTVANNSEGIIACNNKFYNTAYGVLLGNVVHAKVYGNYCKPKKSINTGNFTQPQVFGVDFANINNPTTIEFVDILFENNTIIGGRRGIRVENIESVATKTISDFSIVLRGNYIEDVELEAMRCFESCIVCQNIVKNGYILDFKNCYVYENYFECNKNANTAVRIFESCNLVDNVIETTYATAIDATNSTTSFIYGTIIDGIRSGKAKLQSAPDKLITDYTQTFTPAQNIREYIKERSSVIVFDGSFTLSQGWNTLATACHVSENLEIAPTCVLIVGTDRNQFAFGSVDGSGNIRVYNPNAAITSNIFGEISYTF